MHCGKASITKTNILQKMQTVIDAKEGALHFKTLL